MSVVDGALSLTDLIVLASATGIVLAVTNHYSTLFKRVEEKIVQLEKVDIEQQAKIQSNFEKAADLRMNLRQVEANLKEGLTICRSKCVADLRALDTRLNAMSAQTLNMQNYLAQKTTYKVRQDERPDD